MYNSTCKVYVIHFSLYVPPYTTFYPCQAERYLVMCLFLFKVASPSLPKLNYYIESKRHLEWEFNDGYRNS